MQNLITVIAPQILVAGAYSFVGEIRSVVFELRWMLVFIVAMIIADFVLGIIDSVVKRGEDFRFSRAGRRTMCKFIEYNSYLVLGFGFGVAILQPVGICSYTTSSMCELLYLNLIQSWNMYVKFTESRTRFPLSACWWATLKRSTQRLAKLSKKLQRMKKTDRRLIAEIIYSVIIILLMTISFMT